MQSAIEKMDAETAIPSIHSKCTSYLLDLKLPTTPYGLSSEYRSTANSLYSILGLPNCSPRNLPSST
ncbi:hypothetical protein VTN96DRAFT_9870 [Rasamsonia emersonii]